MNHFKLPLVDALITALDFPLVLPSVFLNQAPKEDGA